MRGGYSVKKLTKIKKVSDNYENYSYHERYLDAFASMFAICEPVAAVLFYDRKFYVSYNKSLSGQKREIAIAILNCLNDVLQGQDEVNDLLNLYINYNTDCTSSIKKYTKKLHDNLEKLFSVQNDDAFKRLGELVVQNADDVEAEIALIQDEVVQRGQNIVQYKNQLDYLFQQDLTNVENYMQLIDYIGSAKGICNHDEFLKLTTTLIRPLQDIEKLIHYLKTHPDNLEQIDVVILENPKIDKVIDTEKLDKYLDNNQLQLGIEILPSTTFEEVVNSLQPINDGDLSQPKIKAITKDLYLHAEMNLAKHFPHLGDVYMGVSRLCCGGCDDVLESIYHYKHRGTHGTLDAAWTMVLMQFVNIAAELENKAKYLRQDDVNLQVALQDRDLSDDEVWTVEESLFLGTDFSFMGYKKDFGMYDGYNILGNHEDEKADQ